MKAWTHFLDTLEADLGKTVVDKWVRSLKVISFDACNLYIQAKDAFQALWFEEHVRSIVQNTLVNPNNHSIQVHVSVASIASKPSILPDKSNNSIQNRIPVDETLEPTSLFETYVPTETNTLPFKIFKQMATGAKPLDISFNPVYLYGKAGSGKTHLLKATAHALIKQGFRAKYVEAESFTSDLVRSLRNGQIIDFRQSYRDVDILFVDNIDILSGKAATQEEFFHTFNTLHLAEKFIVLASRRSPSQLENVEPRLVSRFEWGLSLEVCLPPQDYFSEIYQRRALALNANLAPRVEEFLLRHFKDNFRAAIKALDTLILRAHIKQIPISQLSPHKAHILISDLIESEKNERIGPETILKAVANYYGLTQEDLLSKAQSRDIAQPRQVAIYLCRNVIKMPLKKIGSFFSRDHSTVLSSIRKVEEFRKERKNNIHTALPELMRMLEH